MVNNLISHSGTTSISSGWPSKMGSFDYNILSGSLGASGGWYGGFNTTGMAAIWPTNQLEKTFIVPPDHNSRTSAVDVGQPFTAASTQYPPLPGMNATQTPGAPAVLTPTAFSRYYLTMQPDRGWVQWPPFRMGGLIGAGIAVGAGSGTAF